jgi:hypothetical protein
MQNRNYWIHGWSKLPALLDVEQKLKASMFQTNRPLPLENQPNCPILLKSITTPKTWGYNDICTYHETYCTGSNKQFYSFNECMRFMNALPKVSPVCGNGLLLSGNSSTCRFKHHFMIPLSPELHCFHIGYGNVADAENHYKCNDAVECTAASLAASDPTAINLIPDLADVNCTASDTNSYTTWVPPAMCPAQTGRRLRKSVI